MSQLRLAKATDLEDFPGCAAVIVDTPPIAQCQETQLDLTNGSIINGTQRITKVGAFVGIDLAEKRVTITAPPGEVGTFFVFSNDDDNLFTGHQFAEDSDVVEFTVHDLAEVYLTRNEASFARFVENLGNAHTTINGQLYTDVLTGPLAAACSDTYSPD